MSLQAFTAERGQLQVHAPTGNEALFSLVDRIVAGAQLILRFRTSPTAHALWREELEPQMRATLLSLVQAEREAERRRVDAYCALEWTKQGKCLVSTPRYLRSLPATEVRHARAHERWKEAAATLKASWNAICRHQNLLVARKQMLLGQEFRVLLQAFRAEHDRHAVTLAAVRNEVAMVGSWQGASHCEVLGTIAGDLMAVLEAEATDGDYMIRWAIETRLRAIANEDWVRLRNAAKKEAAVVSTPVGNLSPPQHARFRRSGVGHWDVFFAGVGGTVPHSKGMTYIRKLLANSGKAVHSWTLAHNEPPPETPSELVLDDDALASLRSSVADLTARREASEDQGERIQLEDDIAAIQARITADTRPTGQGRVSRSVNSSAEANRNAFGKAMRKALDDIGRECPALGEHLQEHIHSPTGMQPMYSCPDDVRPSWDLGPDYPE